MNYYIVNDSYTININPEGQSETQLEYTDNNQTKKVFVGKQEIIGSTPASYSGMYYQGGSTPTLSVTPSSHDWITLTLGSVDETNTAAPIMYSATANETDAKRNVTVSLQGNNNITFKLEQNYIPKLMYMIKDPAISNVSYGQWIECIRINNGPKNSSVEFPLTSKKDVSIFNGKSSNGYNNITVEIQPFRNTNVSFGFSQDDTLDKLITQRYTYSVVADSTFITNKSYNAETGYFSFSTSNQNVWNKNSITGGMGDGVIVDVSSHFRFQGTNLPLIDIYISNMLRYQIITSYNLKFTCLVGGTCFIQSAQLPGSSNNIAWPQTTNSSIVLNGLSYQTNAMLLNYNRTGITIADSLFSLQYKVSISGYTYIDYDGIEKTNATGEIPVIINSETTILSINKKFYDGGYENKAYIKFKSYPTDNKQKFIKENWPNNFPDYLRNWETDEFESQGGIDLKITSPYYRFKAGSTSSLTASVIVLSE